MRFVLVPGLVSDRRVWAAVAAALPSGMAVAADQTRDETLPGMAARALAEVDGDVVAIGHSMGARVAMEMARAAPERLRGLVLANTGHAPLRPGEIETRQAKIALGHRSMAELCDQWLPPMVDAGRHGDSALMADLRAMVLAAGATVHERQIRALVARPDAAACLPRIRCPVLLLAGANDRWSPVSQHEQIAALAPDAEVQVIPGAGHFLPLEKPDETAAAVLGWLRRRGLL